ncbi:MAG: outer membrane protein assembly factor BamD, partial [Dinoroseobacter sp.]
MKLPNNTKTVLSPLLLAVFLSACGGGDAVDRRALESFTAREIFDRAEFELAADDPEEAASLFGEVERLYPYSELASRALIMQAFSFHKDRDYENSRASAQRFLDFYPGEEDAAY